MNINGWRGGTAELPLRMGLDDIAEYIGTPFGPRAMPGTFEEAGARIRAIKRDRNRRRNNPTLAELASQSQE